MEAPQFGIVVLDPPYFKSHYQIEISFDVLIEIQKQNGDELPVVAIFTIPSHDPTAVMANLRDPRVMNHRTRLCKQLVLSEDLPSRYPLFSPRAQQPSSDLPLQASAC